jgi:hypothetical protein
VAAKNADAQAIAERKLAAAQAALSRNISGRVSAQNNLNSVTSVGTRLMSGPWAGRWYTRVSYAGCGRMVRYVPKPGTSKKISSGICQPNRSDQRKTSSMTLPEVDSNRRLTVEAMQEQNA